MVLSSLVCVCSHFEIWRIRVHLPSRSCQLLVRSTQLSFKGLDLFSVVAGV